MSYVLTVKLLVESFKWKHNCAYNNPSGKSLILMMKGNGPNIDPCGTPIEKIQTFYTWKKLLSSRSSVKKKTIVIVYNFNYILKYNANYISKLPTLLHLYALI